MSEPTVTEPPEVQAARKYIEVPPVHMSSRDVPGGLDFYIEGNRVAAMRRDGDRLMLYALGFAIDYTDRPARVGEIMGMVEDIYFRPVGRLIDTLVGADALQHLPPPPPFTEYVIRYVGHDAFIDTPSGPVLVGEITVDNGLVEVPKGDGRSSYVPGVRTAEVRDEHGSLIWPYHDLLPLRLPGEGGPGRYDPLIRHPGAP